MYFIPFTYTKSRIREIAELWLLTVILLVYMLYYYYCVGKV